MSKKILLLGLSDSVLADAQQQLARPDLEVFRGTSVEDVRSTMAQTSIDHVFMGERASDEPPTPDGNGVCHLSVKRNNDSAHAGYNQGPQGFPSFVQAVLHGLMGDAG